MGRTPPLILAKHRIGVKGPALVDAAGADK
jgi:hypothetical protein